MPFARTLLDTRNEPDECGVHVRFHVDGAPPVTTQAIPVVVLTGSEGQEISINGEGDLRLLQHALLEASRLWAAEKERARLSPSSMKKERAA